jgi:hypothetical protein
MDFFPSAGVGGGDFWADLPTLPARRAAGIGREVDLQSLLGSMSRDVHICTHWLRV